jgi:hypothetical protein
MRSDVNYSHSKNIGEAVGSFCGVPINSYNTFDLELDVALEAQRTVLRNQAMGCSDAPSTAEILPGEMLCADNIIRRVTTAEAAGYDTFKEKNPVKLLVTGGNYDSENSRHNNPRCVVGASKPRQSTPEELCAWINGEDEQPGFYDKLPQFGGISHEVLAEGDDKIVRANDAKSHLLYAFRYVGGLPGTCIGGDVTRPFDVPQFTVGIHSPSHVVQYFDKDEAVRLHRLKEESAKEASLEDTRAYSKFNFENWQELDKLRRDCDACYAPMSHVDRITVGGTALFVPEEES